MPLWLANNALSTLRNYDGSRVNIDTAAVMGGPLTAAVFDDTRAPPLGFLTDRSAERRVSADSIQRAAHLSRLVFNDSITQTVERARSLSDQLQHIPSERQNEKYEQDIDALKRCLDDALRDMNKEASFTSG